MQLHLPGESPQKAYKVQLYDWETGTEMLGGLFLFFPSWIIPASESHSIRQYDSMIL